MEFESTAARELDALIAELALGFEVIRQKKGTMKERTRQGHLRPLRQYTKDIAAAWDVVERLGMTLIPVSDGQWFAYIGTGERWESPAAFLAHLAKADFANSGAAIEKSAPLAICLTAIRMVEKRTAVPVHAVSQ